MASLTRPLRILWAVDLRRGAETFDASLLSALRAFGPAQIEPVHVLAISTEVSADFPNQDLELFEQASIREIEAIVKKLRMRDVLPPRILLHRSISIRGAVDSLAEYAFKTGADLIIAQTHSRSPLKRVLATFMGSFAETLVTHSRTPVLLAPPQPRQVRTDSILFPTDFGRSAHAQFSQVLALAQRLKASITLFHSVVHPIQPAGAWVYPAGPLGPFPEFVDQQIRTAHRRAEAWVEFARQQSVEMTFILDERGLSPWEQILKVADRLKVGMIAMQAQSGGLARAILGSTTRQVVRHARCPVWVIKPQRARAQRLRLVKAA